MQLQLKSNEEIVKKIVGLIDLIGGEATVSVDFQDGEEPVEFVLQEKVAEELHKALAQKDAEVAEAVKQISATFDDFASAEDTDIDYCRGAKFGLQLSLQYLNTPKSKDY